MNEQSIDNNKKHKQFSLGMAAIISLWFIFSLLLSDPSLPRLSPDESNDIEKLPNFSSITNSQKKKQAFFDFLLPIIVDENIFLMQIRNQLKDLEQKFKLQSLKIDETEWLFELKKDYLVESEDIKTIIQTLLKKIDIIPPSLILAQAAIESGWGTSRFAREANNLFGHWCFSAGCGLVPKQRDDNKAHEVAKFDTINESIRAYLKNLNSFHRYEYFRALRAQSTIKQTGKGVLKLLAGLEAYSEQGNLYIKKVSNLIKHNKLQRFDSLFIEQINKN
ncbi:MAG: Bax protein [Oleiphilaceae bacterium]|jgi:Bax protein